MNERRVPSGRPSSRMDREIKNQETSENGHGRTHANA